MTDKDRNEELNILLIRQSYLVRKIQCGEHHRLAELKQVQSLIMLWHSKEAEKVKMQSRTDELNESENVRIYHHELQRKRIKRSSILKLETGAGMLEGHQACADYLEQTVEDMMLHPAELYQASQEYLLSEVDPVFTPEDNILLLKQPSREDVLDTLAASNLHAAPGTDGITSYFYKHCFHMVGEPLTEDVSNVFSGQKPTLSQRTSKMVFGSKPKRPPPTNLVINGEYHF